MQKKYLLRAALILVLIQGVTWYFGPQQGLILKKIPAQKAWKNAVKTRVTMTNRVK